MGSSLLIAALATGALAAAPESFSFEGVEARASSTSPSAFVANGPDPTVDAFVDAVGDVTVDVRDRVNAPVATYGDRGTFEADLRVGVDTFRITLETVGAPPAVDAQGNARAEGLPFAVPLAGGVRLNAIALGYSGIGPRSAPARAAFVVFGHARVELNGRPIADRAPAQIIALATGVHADDGTHRRLPGARRGDTELIVFVPRVDPSQWAPGYLYAVFEDVAVEVGGTRLPSEPSVAVSVGAGGPVAPVVAELAAIPQLPAPQFEGFAEAAVPGTAPLAAVPLTTTPQPSNAAPATPLPPGSAVLTTPAPTGGPSVSPTQPAVPLPSTVAPANAQPGAAPAVGGSGIPPANAQPATPLIPTPAPAGSAPGTAAPPPTGTAPVVP